MSIQIVDATYTPDLDAARIPGALTGMSGFAPLQRGPYASVSTNHIFNTTGQALHAETFRQIDDTVRLLVFRASDIDSYTSSGVLTNLGTGYNASTTGWSAAAWGNSIYACNKLDATQVSTGATFGSVGDDCPKARYVAANVNFVMLADTDDGIDDLPDQVWWSALQDPTEWTPSIATQAGKVRLLDAPGPIKQIVAFRDLFVVFKENAIFVGEYVGPPFLFQWRMVSSRIGLAASNAVVELDDALYFMHTSGFYKWDGASLQNIGLPVFQTFLNQFGYLVKNVDSPTTTEKAVDISRVRAVGDDIDGIVWWMCYTTPGSGDPGWKAYVYGYNVRSGKWGALGKLADNETASGTVYPQVFVESKHSDMRAFLAADMPSAARIWYLSNLVSEGGLTDLRYPDAWKTGLMGAVTTALQGTLDRSTDALRVYARCLPGSDAAPFVACTVYGYANEQRNVGTQTATAVLNAELDCFDGRLNARFKQTTLTGTNAKWCILAGVGIEYPPVGAR